MVLFSEEEESIAELYRFRALLKDTEVKRWMNRNASFERWKQVESSSAFREETGEFWTMSTGSELFVSHSGERAAYHKGDYLLVFFLQYIDEAETLKRIVDYGIN